MKKLSFEDINKSAFQMVGQDWMLIGAGNAENSNCMTASWGGFGVLWNMNVAFIFVRPVRYTFGFIETNDYFSLSFFNDKSKRILNFCGSNSGRDVNKAKELKMHSIFYENKTIIYEESDLTFVCRKIYLSDIDPKLFIDKSIDDNYPKKDYHRMYVGEITDILVNDQKR